jgi:hypothetical protein
MGVILSLLGILWKGFIVGLAIRFFIAVITRSDVSVKGLFRTGLLFAVLHVILVLGRVYYLW